MNRKKTTFATFVWRITATHTVAYFIAGIFALVLLDYDTFFGVGALSFMRPTASYWVAAGPGLQVIRGVLLSFFLFPFRTIFFETEKGWIKFWLLSFGLSYLLTLSAAPGSFEGVVYTTIPLRYHLIGLPESLLYLTLFTLLMWGWYRYSRKIVDIVAITLVSLIVLMSLMGVLAALGLIKT
ncbi:hypothetical protein [Telluribacter sp. SYSU D00476]|uniref:hypothetical protein n=1 Tax=Telluribacter sp. SYSU D00476 TaxID=2811430 RepID=UPI001FF4C01C|nr:hypothetical protein [Telluribacter sp. SYSU D00476]